jgi:alkanesulfonate monooxygenase SsuD/methylene tetrahydromethanopterin reductase-like flavin-dependent oxidoreductase (luciferase family)
MTDFGFLLPTREIVMSQEVPNFLQILDLAEQAEALGFASVWAGDSVLARPRFEALTTLAAVAARTQRVQLGTAVLLPALRHPVVLANEVASLDLVANRAAYPRDGYRRQYLHRRPGVCRVWSLDRASSGTV